METLNLRQDIIERLAMLNKKNKILITADLSDAAWSSIKLDVQQKLGKWKNYQKPSEIVCYICMLITGVLALIKLAYTNINVDLNKGALLIFITIANMFSSFRRRIRVEKLEKQILLLDLLEKMDSKQENKTELWPNGMK